MKDNLERHREERDAHRRDARKPPYQKNGAFAGCTLTRPKENKLSGHHGDDEHPEKEIPNVEEPRQNILQPAGLALGKIEEMDPLHAELSEFLDRQQIAYLEAINSRIEDKQFGDFMKNDFKEKMSNYAGGEDHLHRGVGYTEPQTVAAGKANHQTIRIGKAGKAASAGGNKQKSPQDIAASLVATGWGPTTSSSEGVGPEASREVSARDFTSSFELMDAQGAKADFRGPQRQAQGMGTTRSQDAQALNELPRDFRRRHVVATLCVA